jgi:tetratricopeptide (TPR) repeat protein
MDSCLFFGKAISDDDKDALAEAKDSLPPDVTLLRARLLFDGGYYIRAVKEISYFRLSNKLSLKDELEYTYRYARLFHKISMADKAIQYYQLTFEKGKNERYYYAANSALLLANIYEGEKEYAKANEYYEQCLSLRSHDYQNSIDQKAQAGLERVAHLYGIPKR